MKMKNILYTIILCFLFSSSVFGEWIYMTSHEGKDSYLNFDTVERNNNLVYIWFLMDLKTKDPWNNLSTMSRYEFDCNIPMRKRIISARGYSGSMGAGELNISDSTKLDWEYPKPDSLLEGVANRLCNP